MFGYTNAREVFAYSNTLVFIRSLPEHPCEPNGSRNWSTTSCIINEFEECFFQELALLWLLIGMLVTCLKSSILYDLKYVPHFLLSWINLGE